MCLFDHANKVFLIMFTIGIHRAERLIYCFFESSNERKMVRRLGGRDYGIVETEVLLHINSFARTVGYEPQRLPFMVSAPMRSSNDIKEYLGFQYDLPDSVHAVSNPTETAGTSVAAVACTIADDEQLDSEEPDRESRENVVDPELASFLSNMYNDEEADVEVVIEDPNGNNNAVDDACEEQVLALNEMEVLAKTSASDLVHRKAIQQAIGVLLPNHNGN